jgi:O-antigen/teichoic acid export membrane protein
MPVFGGIAVPVWRGRYFGTLNPPTPTHPSRSSARARVVAGSFVQIGARIAALACGLLLMGYLTRRLGLGDYGRYALAILLVNWISASLALVIGGALVRLVAGHADGKKYAVTVLQLIALVSGGLCIALFAGAGILATALKSPAIADALRILAIDLPLGALAGIHLGILTARGEFVKNALGSLSGWFFQLVAAVVFLECGFALEGAAWAVVVGGAAQFLLARGMSGVRILSRERVGFADLWSQTRLLAGAQVALRILQGMDLLAVKYFLGVASVAGLYAGVQNIGFAALMLFQPSNQIVLQSLSRSRREENHAEAVNVAMSYLRVALIYGGILVALGVFSQEIALFLLGPQFESAGPLLSLLLIAVAFRIQTQIGQTLISTAGVKVGILLPLVALIAGGMGAFALVIPWAGALGGAVVAAALALGTAIISLRDGLRLMGLHYPWKTLLRVVTATAATAGLAFWLQGFHFHVLVELTLSTGFYGVMLVLLREWTPRPVHLERCLAWCRGLLRLQ